MDKNLKRTLLHIIYSIKLNWLKFKTWLLGTKKGKSHVVKFTMTFDIEYEVFENLRNKKYPTVYETIYDLENDLMSLIYKLEGQEIINSYTLNGEIKSIHHNLDLMKSDLENDLIFEDDRFHDADISLWLKSDNGAFM